MTKDSVKTNSRHRNFLSFSFFWRTIANDLGNSRIKVDSNAESIKSFLKTDSDHKDFLRTLITQSYKRCRCYHLNAEFDVNVALDVLGETSLKLQGSKEDDLLDIELLEEIAWLAVRHFGHKIRMPQSMLTPNNELEGNASAIISLPTQRIRRANRVL